MIPDFSLAGVLPPYMGDPTDAQRSPYETTTLELAERLGTTSHRLMIIEGYLNYRDALRAAGFTKGVQWLDGSFMEDKTPNDIDVVTWVNRPMDIPTQQKLLFEHPVVFDPPRSKKHYFTDGYLINLATPGINFLREATYWFGLFSHQRVSERWKGMLAVELDAPGSDQAARAAIDKRRAT